MAQAAKQITESYNTQVLNFPISSGKSCRPNNKKKGRKSEVYPFEVEDMRKMLGYFQEHEMWIHYLLFTFGANMARRVGDTLSLTWEHVYDESGNFRRDILEIKEDKTDKLANPKINNAVRNAVILYCEKTGCRPSDNNYHNPIFMQLSGTHKGSVLSEDGYRKALKRVAKAVGITYNVGSHSTRKTFGMMSRKLHPNDYDNMELLQTIYNHSDTKTTKRYIGLTKEKVDRYYDDFGNFFDKYVAGKEEYKSEANSPIITVETTDLRDVLKMAYIEGKKNANASIDEDMEMFNTLLGMIEDMRK